MYELMEYDKELLLIAHYLLLMMMEIDELKAAFTMDNSIKAVISSH